MDGAVRRGGFWATSTLDTQLISFSCTKSPALTIFIPQVAKFFVRGWQYVVGAIGIAWQKNGRIEGALVSGHFHAHSLPGEPTRRATWR